MRNDFNKPISPGSQRQAEVLGRRCNLGEIDSLMSFFTFSFCFDALWNAGIVILCINKESRTKPVCLHVYASILTREDASNT